MEEVCSINRQTSMINMADISKTDNLCEEWKPNKYKYRKTANIKRLLFPLTTEMKLGQLLIDTESIKYITPAKAAQEITDIIAHSVGNTQNSAHLKTMTITDITAGVGGNVLNFAKYFFKVNAIEIDPIRYNFLVNNARVYNFNNIQFYYGDSIDILLNKRYIEQDIIFFDPPWGGPNYKYHKSLRLCFDNVPIEELAEKILNRNHANMLVIKLPINYDFSYMVEVLSKFSITKVVLKKMVIVIIRPIQ